jgi:hypothetical protein
MTPRPVLVFDSEVYINWTLFYFRNVETREEFRFEHPMDLQKLKWVIREHRLITFNGIGYDIPILMLALKGATAEELKAASNRIIVHNLKPWNFEKEFKLKVNPTGLDHVDLMEVAPMTGSLKLYGGRMHSRFIQELPIPHDTWLDLDDIAILTQYCSNDLETTEDLYRTLAKQLALREHMSRQYGIDLRSKSDAQIAEAVIRSECEKIAGERVFRPGDLAGNQYTYAIPDWMSFRTLDVLDAVRQSKFIVNDKGGVVMPPLIESKKLTIGTATFKMGIGGLHSTEEQQIVEADSDYVIMDFDVASYYPAIILNQGLYPPHIGPAFLKVYAALRDQRLAAKRSGNKTDADSLKITINGGFGKLGSKWSVLYAPGLMVQVTLTGQLALLMLIESLSEVLDCTVVSANTDGVTVRCHKDAVDDALAAVKAWETVTGFETERTDYRGLYSRDVNNYVAVLTNGDVKTKGVYGKGLPLQKNPVATICSRAVIAYLTKGTPISETVRSSEDMREFVCIRSITGGALYRGEYVGKVVRWYYTRSEVTLTVKVIGNKVPKSEGARPCMEIPLLLPDDLHRDWYITEATAMLQDMGVTT